MHKALHTLASIDRSELVWAAFLFPVLIIVGAGFMVVADGSGASPSGTEALVLTDQAPTGLDASRIDHLAGVAK